jgi:hypothetical protein
MPEAEIRKPDAGSRNREAESRQRAAGFSVTAVVVAVRNLKVRKATGTITLPTTSQ